MQHTICNVDWSKISRSEFVSGMTPKFVSLFRLEGACWREISMQIELARIQQHVDTVTREKETLEDKIRTFEASARAEQEVLSFRSSVSAETIPNARVGGKGGSVKSSPRCAEACIAEH